MEERLRVVLNSLGIGESINVSQLQAAMARAGIQAPSLRAQRPEAICECGGSMLPEAGREARASVLDVTGWKVLTHAPLRRRRSGCTWKEKRAWYNDVAVGSSEYIWSWGPRHELDYFFVYPQT